MFALLRGKTSPESTSIANPPHVIYGDETAKPMNPADLPIYSPFALEIDPMESLLLVNFADDPDEIYLGFEPQLFDDARHGQGLLVIGWRVDGRVDVYHKPGLRLDPETYSIAGQGLAHMVERPLVDAYFRVEAAGVDAYFAFEDIAGRPVEVSIVEQSPRLRKPFGLLAPMGNAATAPSALPLVLLHDFYFVRRAHTTVSIQVDGVTRKPDTLPVPMDGSRMYFLRYSPDPLIATFNPAHRGRLEPLARHSNTLARQGELTFDLVDNDGFPEIGAMRRSYKEREVVVRFSPPLPDLLSLLPDAHTQGTFRIEGDPATGTVSGDYTVTRQGDLIHVEAVPSGGWQPNESKWSVRLIYWMASDFTHWPKTYRWTATLDVKDPAQVTMESGWTRQ